MAQNIPTSQDSARRRRLDHFALLRAMAQQMPGARIISFTNNDDQDSPATSDNDDEVSDEAGVVEGADHKEEDDKGLHPSVIDQFPAVPMHSLVAAKAPVTNVCLASNSEWAAERERVEIASNITLSQHDRTILNTAWQQWKAGWGQYLILGDCKDARVAAKALGLAMEWENNLTSFSALDLVDRFKFVLDFVNATQLNPDKNDGLLEAVHERLKRIGILMMYKHGFNKVIGI